MTFLGVQVRDIVTVAATHGDENSDRSIATSEQDLASSDGLFLLELADDIFIVA